MFRSGTVWKILLSLILLVVLVIAGYGVYRLGYSQGYTAARIAILGGGRATIRPLPFYGGLPFGGFRTGIRFPFFFSFFVPFFWIGIGLLLFFILRALIRPWRGQYSSGPTGPTATNTGSSSSTPAGINPNEAGPYDPYHLRDRQDPSMDQPGMGGGQGSTPS
jgi:hypothetical protein